MFLIAGSAINVQNKEGRTPLHQAVIGRNMDTLTAILKVGASVNIQVTLFSLPLRAFLLGYVCSVCIIIVFISYRIELMGNSVIFVFVFCCCLKFNHEACSLFWVAFYIDFYLIKLQILFFTEF